MQRSWGTIAGLWRISGLWFQLGGILGSSEAHAQRAPWARVKARKFVRLPQEMRGCCGSPVPDLEGAPMPPRFSPAEGRTSKPWGPLLQAAWASRCQSLRLHPRCPQCRPSGRRVFTPHRPASFQIPGLRLQRGCRHCLTVLPLLPLARFAPPQGLCSPLPPSLLSIPALLLTEPHTGLVK